MTTIQNYRRLRTSILAMTLCFALVPMLLVGTLIPMQFTSLYHEKTIREVENVAQAKARSIDVFFEERIAQLKCLASFYNYEELTREGKLAEVLRVLQHYSQSYVDLGVIDMEGTHVAYAGAYAVRDVNYKNELWFQAVQRRGVYVSDVFMGFRQFPHIIIAIMRHEGDRSWILRATIDSEVFNSIVQASKLSAQGDAFVINADNVLQTNSRMAGALMTRANLGMPAHKGFSFRGTLGNREMLFAKIPLVHAQWSLVVAENPSEHLTLLWRTRFFAAIGIVLGMLALGFSTWFITRMLVNRLEAADKEKATLNASLLQSGKMAALGKMAAGVAHEINNPLMLIRETAGWIKDLMEDEKPENMVHYNDITTSAGKIEQHVDRAKDVTHRLLGFARSVNPNPESMLLNPIVEQAIGFLQNEASHRSIIIQRVLASPGPRVLVDVGQLQQVVLNLVDNALDAIGHDGTVTVVTAIEDNNAVIRVQDTGPGLPEDRVEHLFDPFFTTKAPGEGTGLGLSICFSIMEKLGGSISCHNRAEGGAEFVLRLPMHGQAGPMAGSLNHP